MKWTQIVRILLFGAFGLVFPGALTWQFWVCLGILVLTNMLTQLEYELE